MTHNETARTRNRWIRSIALVGLLAVGIALAGFLLQQSLTSSASPAASFPSDTLLDDMRDDGRSRALGEADGVVPEGAATLDDDVPAVANLDPDLLGALRRAAHDAAGGGVDIFVNSGWRSRDYQEKLLRDAIRKYGSEKEAARWVATPDTSPHVSGDAVDVGKSDATAWLSRHGADYGLCQIYRNESWHYELRPEAADRGCPPQYADPAQDPRMRQ